MKKILHHRYLCLKILVHLLYLGISMPVNIIDSIE